MAGMRGLLPGKQQRRGTRIVADSISRAGLGVAVPETILVKSLLLAQHVVNAACQLGGQDAHGLALATLALQLLLELFGPLAGPEKQADRLAKGPAQVGVADLLVA